MKPWLNIIGIGEDGLQGLSGNARALLENAEVIIGGDRHHALTSDLHAERIAWPSPFDAMIEKVISFKGRRIVILVTGDPLWYSVGARILKSIPASEINFHPQLSAFQWAAARMGWSIADLETLTVHGRPAEQIIPYFAPDRRLLVLTRDHTSPGEVATLLRERGFGSSEITVLASLGGVDEKRFDGLAETWSHVVPNFHILAITCLADEGAKLLPGGPGLPDEAFLNDGVMTKSEVRAVTLSRLRPGRGQVLWDIGCGSGSVAIEWLRLVRDGEATGIDTRADRLEMARKNATKLGAPRLKLIEGTALDNLDNLPIPDAIFIGGGLSEHLVERCLAALKPHGRLVANTVTLESEALLISMHARHGGDLTRLAFSRATPIGTRTGWKALTPVTQWSLQR